jgi:hypothetical protein
MRNALSDHPVFICGHPKSGTTLLRAILDSHPQLLVYPDETFYFRGFLPEIQMLEDEERITLAQRYLLHFFSSNRPTDVDSVPQGDEGFKTYAKTCHVMRQLLEQDKPRHAGDLLFATIYAFGLVHNQISDETLYWVEKTPYNEHYANTIFKCWPEARCIHVVRDPRDNYATYHRKHSGLAVEQFSLSWKASLQAGIRSQNLFGKESYMIISYEELTREPDRKLAEIIRFLGIRSDDILRIPTRNGVLWEGNSMFNERFSGISSKPLGRWKSELSNEDVAVIELVCAGWMKRMGYLPEARRTLKARYRLLGWKTRRTVRLPRELMNTARQRYGVLP